MHTRAKNFLRLFEKNGILVIPLSTLAHIEAQGRYCLLTTCDGRQVLYCKHMGALEKEVRHYELLCRVHKSHIINLKEVRTYTRERTGTIILNNGRAVPLASRRRSQFIRKHKALFSFY